MWVFWVCVILHFSFYTFLFDFFFYCLTDCFSSYCYSQIFWISWQIASNISLWRNMSTYRPRPKSVYISVLSHDWMEKMLPNTAVLQLSWKSICKWPCKLWLHTRKQNKKKLINNGNEVVGSSCSPIPEILTSAVHASASECKNSVSYFLFQGDIIYVQMLLYLL